MIIEINSSLDDGKQPGSRLPKERVDCTTGRGDRCVLLPSLLSPSESGWGDMKMLGLDNRENENKEGNIQVLEKGIRREGWPMR